MSDYTSSPFDTPMPRTLLVLIFVALLWNALGVMAFINQMLMSATDMAALPQGQRALLEATPFWANLVFAVAVFAGSLGCVLFLMRKRHAKVVLQVSLAAVLIQMFHSFYVLDSFAVFGPGGLVMPVMVVVVAVGLVYLSHKAIEAHWLT